MHFSVLSTKTTTIQIKNINSICHIPTLLFYFLATFSFFHLTMCVICSCTLDNHISVERIMNHLFHPFVSFHYLHSNALLISHHLLALPLLAINADFCISPESCNQNIAVLIMAFNIVMISFLVLQ